MKRNSDSHRVGLVLSIGIWASTVCGQTSLSVGNVSGYPGATVAVPIGLRQLAGSAVAAQFDVAFNPGKVSALDATLGERLTNHVIRSRQIAPGVERVLIYSFHSAPAGTNVTIANLPFAVPSSEYIGSGPLTLSNVWLAKADATALAPVQVNSGNVFVRPVNLLPGGEAQFFIAATPDRRYAIQATTNLVDWVNISTNLATSSFMDLLDNDAAGRPYRFYRWELLLP